MEEMLPEFWVIERAFNWWGEGSETFHQNVVTVAMFTHEGAPVHVCFPAEELIAKVKEMSIKEIERQQEKKTKTA